LSNTALPSLLPKFSDEVTCPDCSAPHEPDSGDFCEICGYNFVTGAHGELPIAVSHPPVSPPSSLTWEITITLDSVAHDPASPPSPGNFTPFSLRLEQRNNLIGRTSQARLIHPEISLDFDDAISHRHALLNLNPDGTLTLRDIGSSNGTKLNNVEVKPMVDALLKNGDEITLGHWTRIKVKGET
jgi:hypothetical protein